MITTPLRYKQNIRIFAISVLESKNERLAKLSKERREQLADQLEPLKIKYEIFPGVDGYGLTEEEQRLREESNQCAKHYPYIQINVGSFCNALAQVRLYEKIVKENIKEALILEDDSYFLQDFFPILFQRNVWAPKNWQILHFHRGHINPGIAAERLYYIDNKKQYQAIGYKCIFSCSNAYVIKLSTAKYFLKKAYPIRQSIDRLIGNNQKNYLHVYSTHPAICITKTRDHEEYISTFIDNSPAKLLVGDKRISIKRMLLGVRKVLALHTRLHYCVRTTQYAFYKLYWRIFPPKSIALD